MVNGKLIQIGFFRFIFCRNEGLGYFIRKKFLFILLGKKKKINGREEVNMEGITLN